jgi:fluoroquinolone transport system permease protein
LGVTFTSCVFTLIGLAMTAFFKTVNGYLFVGGSSLVFLFFPLLNFFKITNSPFFYVLPTQYSLLLFRAVIDNKVSAWEIVVASLVLAIFSILFFVIVKRLFNSYNIYKRGTYK